MEREGLYSSIAGSARLEKTSASLAEGEHDFYFGMLCNGFFRSRKGKWHFNPNTQEIFLPEFTGQRVSFFGPFSSSSEDGFYKTSKEVDRAELERVFNQQPVVDAIGKYRDIDEDQAARIAFIFGGVARYLRARFGTSVGLDDIVGSVNLVAEMAKLGEKNSGDAIASAMAMYVISSNSFESSREFKGGVFHMSEAIRGDTIEPVETADLGLSQVARLKSFLGKVFLAEAHELEDISEVMGTFENFPTVGAEFHFPVNSQYKYPNFWQRLAILNMSQYQRGSFVQLSRNDRDVIEVRMNPSVYPVSIANWNHIRRVLPELDEAFFSVTIGRDYDGDFHWSDLRDEILLNKLSALGLLTYAGMFVEPPKRGIRGEVNFGDAYVGQTVRLHGGEYKFSGVWAGDKGNHGQLSVYAGFGDNFPQLAYYLSMALAKPDILKFLPSRLGSRGTSLEEAFSTGSRARSRVFRTLQRSIAEDGDLSKVYDAGNKIMERLNPGESL